MFYHFIYPYHDFLSFLNLFQYITFRSGAAFLTALYIALYAGPFFIDILKHMQKTGQPIRQDGPETHYAKAGTPTMGGVILLASIGVSTLLWGKFTSPYTIVMLFSIFGFGLIGGVDDYKKVIQKNPKGLSGKIRLLLGFFLIGGLALWIEALAPNSLKLLLALPFSIEFFFPSLILFVLFVVLVVVGTANAVNLTDGLDGLAAGTVFIASGAFAIITYLSGHSEFSDYLNIQYVPMVGEVTVILAAMMGACLGFLWFNAPPALIFMGDTGSLALGAGLGMASVLTRHEIVLIIIGGIFVAETVSVILQVCSFKITGKRIFKMAPLHHHFEKKGWPETRVVMRFWIIAIVLALLGLATLKVR